MNLWHTRHSNTLHFFTTHSWYLESVAVFMERLVQNKKKRFSKKLLQSNILSEAFLNYSINIFISFIVPFASNFILSFNYVFSYVYRSKYYRGKNYIMNAVINQQSQNSCSPIFPDRQSEQDIPIQAKKFICMIFKFIVFLFTIQVRRMTEPRAWFSHFASWLGSTKKIPNNSIYCQNEYIHGVNGILIVSFKP